MGRFVCFMIRGLALIAAFVFVTSVVATSTAWAQSAEPDTADTHFDTFWVRVNSSLLRREPSRLTFAEMTDPVAHGLVERANEGRIVSAASLVCRNTGRDASGRKAGLYLHCDRGGETFDLDIPNCHRSDDEIAGMSIVQARAFVYGLFPRGCRSREVRTRETDRHFRPISYPTSAPVTPGHALGELTGEIVEAVGTGNHGTMRSLIERWYDDGQRLARSHAQDVTPELVEAFDRAYNMADMVLRDSVQTVPLPLSPPSSSRRIVRFPTVGGTDFPIRDFAWVFVVLTWIILATMIRLFLEIYRRWDGYKPPRFTQEELDAAVLEASSEVTTLKAGFVRKLESMERTYEAAINVATTEYQDLMRRISWGVDELHRDYDTLRGTCAVLSSEKDGVERELALAQEELDTLRGANIALETDLRVARIDCDRLAEALAAMWTGENSNE